MIRLLIIHDGDFRWRNVYNDKVKEIKAWRFHLNKCNPHSTNKNVSFMFRWPCIPVWSWKYSQLGEQFFLVRLYLFSTCFGRLCAHHQDKQLYLCDTWYLLFCMDDCQVCKMEWIPPCIPESHPYRITSTKCRINTVVSPDDGHIVTRNMQRKEINIQINIVHQVGFIYKKKCEIWGFRSGDDEGLSSVRCDILYKGHNIGANFSGKKNCYCHFPRSTTLWQHHLQLRNILIFF